MKRSDLPANEGRAAHPTLGEVIGNSMAQSSTTRNLTAKKGRGGRSDLVFWLLIPLFFGVGVGLAAFLDARFGPAGIVALICAIGIGAVAVLLWPGND